MASEETVRVNLQIEGGQTATVTAEGLQKLLDKLGELEDIEVSNNAADAMKALLAAAKAGGAAAENALQRLDAAAKDAAHAAESAMAAWRESGGTADGVAAVVAKINEATAAAKRLEQARTDSTAAAKRLAEQEQAAAAAAARAAVEAARAAARAQDRADAAGLAERMRTANLTPAHLKVGQEAMDPDWMKKGLEKVSTEQGSALKAAANDALVLAANIAKSETAAKKLSSVYELVAKRAEAARRAEAAAMSDAERAATRLPTALQAGAAPKQMGGFQQLVGIVNKLFGARAAGGLVEGASALSRASDSLGPLGPMLAKGGSVVALGAVALAAAAAAVVVAAGVIAAQLLYAGAQLAIQATSARQAFVDPLSKILGDSAAASAVYSGAVKVAVDLGIDKEEVLKKAKALVGVGFRGEEINVILRAQADIGEVIGDDKAQGFIEKLKQIKSGKAFNIGVVEGLAETGVNVDLVLKKLSQQLGISVDKVKEKLKAGSIDVGQGVKAILAAADEQFGGAAAKGAQSIPRLVTSLKTLLEGLFDSVDLTPMKEALDNLKTILSGPEGEKLKNAVNLLFGTVFKTLFAAFQGEEGQARLTRFITAITMAMEGAAKIIGEAGPEIITIIDGLSKFFDGSGSSTNGSWLTSIAQGILAISGATLGLDFNAMISDFMIFIGYFESMGSDLIAGLVNGITSGASRVVDALVGVVNAAITAANQALGRKSPAKKTIDMGADTSEGLEIGILSRLNRVQLAGSTMAASALAGASAANDNAGAAVPAAGGGGGGVTIIVQVQAGPGVTREAAQAQGEAVGEGAYRGWRRNMARWTREELKAS